MNFRLKKKSIGNPRDSQPILIESRKSLWNLRAPHDPLQVLGYCLRARVEHSRPLRKTSVCNNPWPIIRPAVGSRLRHTSNLQEACGHKGMCPVQSWFRRKRDKWKERRNLDRPEHSHAACKALLEPRISSDRPTWCAELVCLVCSCLFGFQEKLSFSNCTGMRSPTGIRKSFGVVVFFCCFILRRSQQDWYMSSRFWK